MNARTRVFSAALMVMLCSLTFAQTPTPLPGIPQALTCMDFTFLPGLSGFEVITNWLYLDRAGVVLENNTGGAIEIAACQGYFSQTENPLIIQLRIWEIQNEGNLPDLPSAATQVSETYAFSIDPVVGNPQVALITFDLMNYPGVAMPVINPGKKFVVDIINLMDEGGSGLPGMKITAEQVAECPSSFWNDETNLFGDQSGSTLTWNFKEDIGLATNLYLGVTYFDNADPRTPAMGTFGIVGILVFLSFALSRRRK